MISKTFRLSEETGRKFKELVAKSGHKVENDFMKDMIETWHSCDNQKKTLLKGMLLNFINKL